MHGVPPLETELVSSSAIASDDSSYSLDLPTDDPTLTLPPPRISRLFNFIHIAIRPAVTALVVALAILIPDFGRVLSFLGSASAFLICCIGPIGAYREHKIFVRSRDRELTMAARPVILGSVKKDKPTRKMGRPMKVEGAERVLCWFLLVVSIMFAVTGTVWSFLPVD